jgi:hypothetical protein
MTTFARRVDTFCFLNNTLSSFIVVVILRYDFPTFPDLLIVQQLQFSNCNAFQ